MSQRLHQRLDAALPPSIARAAAPWNTYYTERQLFYEVCRTLRPMPGLLAPQSALSAGVGLAPALLACRAPRRAWRLATADALVVGALWGIRNWPYVRSLPCRYEDVTAALARYRARHGEPDGLLPPAPPLPLARYYHNLEYDLADYGVARVLVCQSPAIAHMLLANRFFMDMKCAILALPNATPLPDNIAAMLARSPDAQVFVLHDASAEGLALADPIGPQLAAPAGVPVRSIGLRPTHARRLHLFATRMPATPDSNAPWYRRLSPHERAWVQQGLWAEVAAISPPDFLLKLRRIISGNILRPGNLLNLVHKRHSGFMTWPTT